MAKLYNIGTNKQGLIVYNGESSADYGMVISEAPTFEKPQRKQTAFTVPGRNGAVIFQEDAWEDVTRNYKVWLSKSKEADLAKTVNAFSAWLNSQKGYLRLEDNFEPDIFRLAYYSGGNNISNELMQYGETTLTFTCRPERFYKEAQAEVRCATSSPYTSIYNPTRFTSKPLLHIEMNTTAKKKFQLGGKIFWLEGVTDYVNIDCETMNVYRQPGENKNSCFSGDFPVMVPGNNTMALISGVTYITVRPRFFTI